MKYAIGVDIGGTNIPASLVDEKGRIIQTVEKKTDAHDGPEAVTDRITDSIKELMSKTNTAIMGIGLGVPGALDLDNGVIETSPNLKDWKKVPILKMLKQKTKLDIYMDNDANCAAIAEHWIGGARGSKNAIVMTLGTGVGGGIIINDKIFRGSHGTAGEIGHITIERNGRACACGNLGCLESYASATGAILTAKELGLQVNTAHDIFLKAEAGDRTAIESLKESGKHLGIGIACLANIFDPDVIIIGGGFASAEKYLFPAAKEEAYKRALKTVMDKIEIKRAELSNNAGVVGAARLVFLN